MLPTEICNFAHTRNRQLLMAKTIISHLYRNEDTGQWVIQTNAEHCRGVAELTAAFCRKLGMAEYGHWCGILHDLGKERRSFQDYIRRVSGYDCSRPATEEHSHAYAGALAAMKLTGPGGILAAAAIAGHHRGLYDQAELIETLKTKQLPPEVSLPAGPAADLKLPPIQKPSDVHMLGRMLFSALVDADYLDTERFMKPDEYASRGGAESVEALLGRLESHLAKLKASASDSHVNRIRNSVQQYCREHSKAGCGIYSLTVPTGGGKTLSSVLWALKHCVTNGMDGIIIAIPYTSIIEQTARILRAIFGDGNVLEHHSGVVMDGDDDLSRRLAAENWDRPIVVTTNVQLFESLYHNRSSKCRKLHNVANRVIILDEVQTLPPSLLQPLTASLECLQRVFRCSVLLTTASQPILRGTIKGCGTQRFEGFRDVREIIPAHEQLHRKLKRVEIEFNPGRCSYDELAGELQKHPKVLCIVNTRKAAAQLFDLLPADCKPLHLSRMMCSAHIRKKLAEATAMLRDPACERLTLISTQLIEAGVDVDFPVVYRQEAGLDSILQAAGRCNREGRQPRPGKVCVFAFDDNSAMPRGTLTAANDARRNMRPCHDLTSPEAMDEYFTQFYARCGDFDKHDIAAELWLNGEVNYQTAAEKFKYIEDNAIPVIVNYENSSDLVELLKKGSTSRRLFRELAQYSVNLSRRDFRELLSQGAIEEVCEGVFRLWPAHFYSEAVGVTINNHWTEETFII